MNIRDIEAFVAVAEAGSVNRAAHRLNLSQPAVTRRLQNFEAALGDAALLDRSAKPPVLTPHGRQVLENCRSVLKALRELKANSTPGVPSGTFRLGVAHGLSDIVLSSPLDDLRQRYAQVQLRISAQWTSGLVEDVRNGSLDCAIALIESNSALPSSLNAAALDVEDLVIVGSRQFELSGANRVAGLNDIANQGWILNPPGCGYRAAIQRLFDRQGMALDIAAEVFGHDLQLSLVARGAGLTIVPRRKLETSIHRPALRIIRVSGLELQTTITLLHGDALGSFASVTDWLHARISAELNEPTITA
ncbi:LysR family transcriptional regulator [Breoghania corrubedonensis]|nr:LysR family transcriptional regulator [Breoghania corrubedonensis]